MEKSGSRGAEFQVIIVVDGEDGRMFPLTENYPRCLLPVGNRKLLSYQLDMLNMSGASGETHSFIHSFIGNNRLNN